MNFFDREEEMASLREINERSKNVSQFTVVTGRRRIGKTSLVWKAYDDRPILYFFVARKIEADLCESFLSEMQEKLDVPMVGHPVHFAEIFEFLMRVSVDKPITVFIDEFQEFSRVNPSVFSDMQRIWDEWHERSHINLIVCGSIFSMMEKIFKNKKEPLYNRQTNFINVRHFSTMTLKEILHEYNAEFTSEDLLALFSFTGGIAKYVQLLIDAGAGFYFHRGRESQPD
jgi:AAA+ ATPase superfamily predicted ATPase